MSSQPIQEWDDMSEQTQNEIRTRLHNVIEDAERASYRGRLARGASYSGLAARLEAKNI